MFRCTAKDRAVISNLFHFIGAKKKEVRVRGAWVEGGGKERDLPRSQTIKCSQRSVMHYSWVLKGEERPRPKWK